MKLKGRVEALIGASILSWLYGSLIFGLLGRLAPLWMEKFHVGKGAIGLLMTISLFAMGIAMYYAGRLADEKGTRLALSVGVLLAGAALLGFAYVNNIAMLYLCGMILGVSGSLEYGAGLACVQRWWPNHSGLVSGIFNLCFGASAAAMVPLYHYWLQTGDYFQALIWIASLVVIVGLIFAQFTESPKKGDMNSNVNQRIQDQKKIVQPAFFTVKEAIKTSSFWLLWTIWALAGTAGAGLVMLMMSLSKDLGFTLAQGTLLLAAFNVLNGIIRMVVGPLADKFSGKVIMVPIFAIGAIACFILPTARSFSLAVVCLALIGMTLGTVFTVSPVLVRKYFGLRHYGAIFGLIFTSYCFFSALAGPFLGGVVRDITGSFSATSIYFGVFLAVAAGLAFLLKPAIKSETAQGPQINISN
jgi:OFA family oxalate/formate antiporter-like MFS transporter